MNSTRNRAILLAIVGVGALCAVVDVHAAGIFGAHLFSLDPSTLGLGLAGMGLAGEVANVDAELVTKELKRISDQVKEEGAKALDEAKRAGAVSDKTKQTVDELLLKQGELQSIVSDLAQKAIKPDNIATGAKSIGQQVAESDEFKALAKKGHGRISIEVKAVTTVDSSTTGTGAGGAWVRPDRITNPMVSPGLRRLTIRDLMAQGRTVGNLIEYVKETGFQNMAAIVAEGVAKAQSDLAFALVQAPVATIAHWLRATKLILDDAPMLQSYIDTRLRYGLALVEEAQLLMGSGTGGNLNGIYTQSTAYSPPTTVTSPTSIDLVRLAILQVEVAEYPCTGIVMNPVDWAQIELLKDSQGRYIIGNPQGSITPKLWNRDVVATNAMTVDKFLVGAFSMASQIFDREDGNVQVSTEDQDNFIKNLVTIRAEERLGMAVYRPEAFVNGDFGRIV